MDRWIDGQIDGQMDRWIDGYMDRLDGLMDRQIDGKIDRWIDRQIDRWIDIQMDSWIETDLRRGSNLLSSNSGFITIFRCQLKETTRVIPREPLQSVAKWQFPIYNGTLKTLV